MEIICTGIITEKEPEFIKRISDDGHEIESHYYFHDVIKNEVLEVVEKNLIKLISLLEEVSDKISKVSELHILI